MSTKPKYVYVPFMQVPVGCAFFVKGAPQCLWKKTTASDAQMYTTDENGPVREIGESTLVSPTSLAKML